MANKKSPITDNQLVKRGDMYIVHCQLVALENIAAARPSVENLLICGGARFILYDSTARSEMGDMYSHFDIVLVLKNLSGII